MTDKDTVDKLTTAYLHIEKFKEGLISIDIYWYTLLTYT